MKQYYMHRTTDDTYLCWDGWVTKDKLTKENLKTNLSDEDAVGSDLYNCGADVEACELTEEFWEKI